MGDVHAHALPSSGTQSHARCPAVRPGAEVRTDHCCFLETLAERVAYVTPSSAARREVRRALGRAPGRSRLRSALRWRHFCALDRHGLELRQMKTPCLV